MLNTKRVDGHLPVSLKRNTRDEYLTRSSEQNKRTCSGGEDTTELLISGDFLPGSNQRVRKELNTEVASKLSKSIVSLSFNNGDAVLFECSGIALERVKHATRFLTSSSFARALIDKRKDCNNLKVEVRHGGSVFPGVLREYYDLDHNIVVVAIMSSLDVDVVVLNTQGELLPHTEVVALGYDISGKLMISSGIVTGDSSVSESCRDTLKLSTCKISKVCEGGPLFDYDGKFRGMNFFCDKERTFCLPTRTFFFFQLEDTKSLLCTSFPVRPSFFRAIRVGERLGGEAHNSKQAVPRGVVNKDQFGDLDSRGYPKPTTSMLNDDMILVNTFEDPFGDEFGQGVWKELDATVSSNIASFDGERRFFVCSGFFIEWNGCSTILTSASLVRKSGFEHKIDENLRAGIGGPLLDFDGRFLAMNFYERTIGTPYLRCPGTV